MPEGPEVLQFAKDLHSRICNTYLISISHDGNSRYKNDGIPGINLLPYSSYYVSNVFTKGKHIFVQIHNHNNPYYFIFIEIRFGEAGRLSLEKTKHSNICFEFCDTVTLLDNFVFHGQKFQIYFEDARHRGAIEIRNQEDTNTKLKKLGPDLLMEQINFQNYLSILNKCKQTWQVCQFLMDQSKFCGIGNYLKADVLYLCKIRPDRLLQNLSDQDKHNLYYYSLLLIREAYAAGGLTIKDYYTIDGEVGAYKKKIYGKGCDDYGNIVIKTEFKDKRTSHWVPNIQV